MQLGIPCERGFITFVHPASLRSVKHEVAAEGRRVPWVSAAGRASLGPVGLRGQAALWRLYPAPSTVRPSRYFLGLVGRKENPFRWQVVIGK